MDPGGMRRADRQLGWLMSLGGIVLILGQTSRHLTHAADFAPWWNAGGILVALTIIGLAAAGRALPDRVLAACWLGAPVLGAVLQLTSFVAYRGTDPDAVLPWAWTMEPVLVSYLVLRLRPPLTVAFALTSALLPVLSGLLFLGRIPEVVMENTPAHLSNIGFVAIFLGIRANLERLRIAEAQAEEQERRRVRTKADARRKEDLARLVHDDLLSVLTAAMALRGDPPAELRGEATSALTLLEKAATSGAEGDEQRTTREALADLVAVVRAIDPVCEVRSHVASGSVSGGVIDCLGQAAAEALRNSARHAGPEASRLVDLQVGPDEVVVTVRDDGRGFDLDAIDPARLGVRSSIVARMRALEGGHAEIRTAPGAGTEVALAWAM